jgi:hypothetical protein
MNREYVIASTKHMTNGFLEFWGKYTPDDATERSECGYWRDLNICERFTKDELEKTHRRFPYYRKGVNPLKHEHFFIKVSDLEKIGKEMTVIYLCL